MIATAIALRPRLLIADEPTTALDVTIQSEILALILDLKKELKMSVLFITHDFGIINKVADSVLVVKNGKVIEEGKKTEIFSFPKKDYTKRLLEAVPKVTLETARTEKAETALEVKDLDKAFTVEKGVFAIVKR